MITTIYGDKKYYGDLSSGGNYLMHHGTEKMKWGNRLYQYKDGTLTPLGRLRYLKNPDVHRGEKSGESEAEKEGSSGSGQKSAGRTGKKSGQASGDPKPENKKTAIETIADATVEIAKANKQNNKGGQNDQNKKDDKFTTASKALNNAKSATDQAKNLSKNLEELSNMKKNNRDAKTYDDNVSKFKKESLSKMSDEELDAAINEWTDKRLNEVARLEKEKSLTTLMYGNRPEEKAGSEKINTYLTAAGSVAATAASVALLMSELKKLGS